MFPLKPFQLLKTQKTFSIGNIFKDSTYFFITFWLCFYATSMSSLGKKYEIESVKNDMLLDKRFIDKSYNKRVVFYECKPFISSIVGILGNPIKGWLDISNAYIKG